MGPGTDPHLYTATPRDRKTLLESDVILYCGHHLEGKMGDVLGNLADEKSDVWKKQDLPRSYVLLAGLNNKPRNAFLARINNPNPTLKPEKEDKDHE